jgi:hypothetical protein
MWKRYFGPHARIIGIDVNPACKDWEEDQIEIRIGDQSDENFLQSLIDEFGPPDIVLDDGSHMMSHVGASFQFLYPRVAKNGIYMVEDLHTAYWDEFEGGLHKSSTFIERCKQLIDELNADHTRGALPATEFTKSTLSMHFYDSVAVFERGAHTKKFAPQTGTVTRPPAPATLPTDFSPDRYLKLNPDVAVSGADPGQHYLEHGFYEGRRY